MKMNFICLNPTNKIVFHQNDLSIDESKLKISSSNGQEILEIQNTQYDSITEFYTINLNGVCIQNTNYSLLIEFIGPIRKDLEGFYKSSYLYKGKVVL